MKIDINKYFGNSMYQMKLQRRQIQENIQLL